MLNAVYVTVDTADVIAGMREAAELHLLHRHRMSIKSLFSEDDIDREDSCIRRRGSIEHGIEEALHSCWIRHIVERQHQSTAWHHALSLAIEGSGILEIEDCHLPRCIWCLNDLHQNDR